MALYSPDTLRRRDVTPFVSAGDASGVAAGPAAPAASGTVAGNAARAAGTRAGQLVRNGTRDALNATLYGVGKANQGIVAGVNALTYPARVVAGFSRDFTNAVSGDPTSPSAGEPAPGLRAPSIATIDWNKVDASRAANDAASAVEAPAATATTPAPNSATLNRPAPIWNSTAADLAARGALANPPVPAGRLPVAPVIRPAAETGVTLPGDRKLAYGAMVNGVPTFSDGSGGFAGHAASIPATMTPAEISGLGDRLNTVSSAAFTNPVDPYNGQSSDAAVASLMRSRQGSKFGITPEQNAAADLAAVASQDPRSTLGRAALNASRSANAASTTLQRKQALEGLANLQDAVSKNAIQSISDPAALARVNAEGQSTLQRQALANKGDLARQNLANEGDLARADLTGKYDVLGRMAQGQAKTTLTEKDLNAQAIKLLPQVLGLNAMGQVDDKTAPGGSRPATEQEIAGAIARAKAIIQGQLAPSGGAKPTLDQFMVAARKVNPNASDADLKAYYTKNYGG